MSLHVAVYGSYDAGNFGDDLMALLLVKHLMARHITPLIIGTSIPLSLSAPCSVTSVTGALRQSHLCLFGGGSLLASKQAMPDAYHRLQQQRYSELIDALTVTNVPLFFVSIGGDGSAVTPESIGAYRWNLLKLSNSRAATVRLPADVYETQKLTLPSSYYPDIVLRTREVIGGPRARRGPRMTLCVNLPRRYRVILPFISLLQTVNPRLDVVMVGSWYNSFGVRRGGELYWPRETPRRRNVPYVAIRQTVEAVRCASTVITPKLHLGVVALSYGVPYVLVGASAKAQAFLGTVGPHVDPWPDTAQGLIARITRYCMSPRRIRPLIDAFDWKRIEELTEHARGHFNFIDEVCGQA